MNVTLVANGVNFSSRLSSFSARLIPEYGTVVQTLDGKEHIGRRRSRLEIVFSLIPFTDAQSATDYNALKAISFSVTVTVPELGGAVTRTMRCTSNLDAIFGLSSVDGNRYYKAESKITLRAVEAENA